MEIIRRDELQELLDVVSMKPYGKFLITGAAGSGKTFLLNIIGKILEEQGREIWYEMMDFSRMGNKMGDAIMAVSYNKLWKLLVDKKMSKSDLRKKAEIAPNTMTKLRRDEEVSLTILSKICKTLHVDFGDIVEYVPDAEIWDLYNENRELLGKDHVRGEQLPIDGYHLVVHVWIRNSKGEYLISQRSANRPTYPLMWECVGGSVVKGEDSLLGAIREAKEEVGVDLMPENGQVLFTKTRKIIEGKIFNDIMDVWLFEYDGEVDLGNATTDEVAQVAWMNREQIKELFEHNMFVETLEYFFMEVDKERS